MTNTVDTTILIVTTYDGYNAISSSNQLSIQGTAGSVAGIYNAAVGPMLNIHTISGAGNLAGINAVAVVVTLSKINNDLYYGRDIQAGDVVSIVGTGVTAIAAVAAAVTGVAAAPWLLSALGLATAISSLYANLNGYTVGDIRNSVTSLYHYARNARSLFFRDPLTLDLDGDGIETVGIDPGRPILFDHDGDGIKSATGWIHPHDGLLVLDRNGNGVIDNGGELFGDSTLISDGSGGTRTAVDGFEALSAEDTNHDGRVDVHDANFTNLRIWRDLNQDGISQENELSTLTDLGIVSLHTAKTANNIPFGNGTVIADLGTYTKADGSLGTAGQTAQMADVNFPTNSFYNRFPDILPITPEAQLLPDMQGSGLARSLREAASIGSGGRYRRANVIRQIGTKVPLRHRARFASVVVDMKCAA